MSLSELIASLEADEVLALTANKSEVRFEVTKVGKHRHRKISVGVTCEAIRDAAYDILEDSLRRSIQEIRSED